ncbi:peptidyl-tRNA hydrolase-domain-containing protein [Hyaloraphidium curvatum]|nr:peptidyl-tRNA hydrolase-domain-containing protein [Hyaloraphidium curvatum]
MATLLRRFPGPRTPRSPPAGSRPLHLLVVGLGNPPFRGQRHDLGAVTLDHLVANLPPYAAPTVPPTFNKSREMDALVTRTLSWQAEGTTAEIERAGVPKLTKFDLANLHSPQKHLVRRVEVKLKMKASDLLRPTETVSLPAVSVELTFAKPASFMNASGGPVRKLADAHGIQRQHILVLHDDMRLDVGKADLQRGGSSGGQKGVEDVAKRMGPDFSRMRLGIGRSKKMGAAKWVLSDFYAEEWTTLRERTFPEAEKLLLMWLEEKIDEARKKAVGKEVKR